MKASIIACCLLTAIGALSMGLLGALLVFPSYPALKWIYFRFIEKSAVGDNTWPAMILVSLLWPLSLVAAGWTAKWFSTLACGRWSVAAAYAAVVWGWSFLLWVAALFCFKPRLFPLL